MTIPRPRATSIAESVIVDGLFQCRDRGSAMVRRRRLRQMPPVTLKGWMTVDAAAFCRHALPLAHRTKDGSSCRTSQNREEPLEANYFQRGGRSAAAARFHSEAVLAPVQVQEEGLLFLVVVIWQSLPTQPELRDAPGSNTSKRLVRCMCTR